MVFVEKQYSCFFTFCQAVIKSSETQSIDLLKMKKYGKG